MRRRAAVRLRRILDARRLTNNHSIKRAMARRERPSDPPCATKRRTGMTPLALPVRTDHRRGLQIAVALAGCVPVSAGLAGILKGPDMAGPATASTSLDSHFSYLSGLLLGIGLAFWSAIPRIEQRTTLFRLLTAIIVIGGLARAYSLYRVGLPGLSMRLALVMELGITPALCLWQGRVARAMDAPQAAR